MNQVHKLQAKLERGELCFGTHCYTADPDFYEICGMLGYDYVWIDSEHASITFPLLKNAIIATNAGGISAIVRVADHQMCNVKPVLESGADGVVFPMVNTAEQAKQCVSHCVYPPKGTRGYGPIRAQDYNVMPLDVYLEKAEKRVLKLMQCEHVESVRNLDAILEVEGVDGIICGLMDLSGSIGKLGQLNDPEVMELAQTIIDKCKAHGKPFGLSTGMDRNVIKFWISQGATLLSAGNPLDCFRLMSNDLVKFARDIEKSR